MTESIENGESALSVRAKLNAALAIVYESYSHYRVIDGTPHEREETPVPGWRPYELVDGVRIYGALVPDEEE